MRKQRRSWRRRRHGFKQQQRGTHACAPCFDYVCRVCSGRAPERRPHASPSATPRHTTTANTTTTRSTRTRANTTNGVTWAERTPVMGLLSDFGWAEKSTRRASKGPPVCLVGRGACDNGRCGVFVKVVLGGWATPLAATTTTTQSQHDHQRSQNCVDKCNHNSTLDGKCNKHIEQIRRRPCSRTQP